MNNLDLQDFSVASPLVVPPSPLPPRHQPGEAFLKGPIPWDWLVQAGQLHGKTLQIALVLWREAGIRHSRTVPFRLSLALQFGIHADTARRALHALEKSGLVATRYVPGRYLEVTLRDAKNISTP